MIGYKVAVGIDERYGAIPVLVTLEIPEDAEIVCPNTTLNTLLPTFINPIKKLRTNKAKVTAMSNLRSPNHKTPDKAYSLYELGHQHKVETIYEIGAVVESYLDKDITLRCARGIHFFEKLKDFRYYYCGEEGRWIHVVIRDLDLDIFSNFQSVKNRIEVR